MAGISFSAYGLRAFEDAPRHIQEHIIGELESLADDPAWFRRVKKLQGSEDRYRIRLGRWRILFSLRNRRMEIMDVFLKKERGDYRRRGL